MSYQEGHIKRDPVAGTVAIRTVFPDTADFAHMQWLTATTGRGAHNRTNADVEGWDDLYVPEPVVEYVFEEAEPPPVDEEEQPV